jgi:hypothetical protein
MRLKRRSNQPIRVARSSKGNFLIVASSDKFESSLRLTRKSVTQRRQHIFGEMPFKLFNSSEVFLARRTPGLHNPVFRVHERIQIVAKYFLPKSFQQLRLFHADLSSRSFSSGSNISGAHTSCHLWSNTDYQRRRKRTTKLPSRNQSPLTALPLSAAFLQ